jgi:hypothetical protein
MVEGRRRGIRVTSPAMGLMGAAAALSSLYIGGRVLAVAHHSRQISRTSDCLDRLKQINLAAAAYAEDHGGHAPPASNWTRALRPYMREPVFQCPAAKRGTGGYAYNAAIAGKYWNTLRRAGNLVAFFDGPPGGAAIGDANSVAYRHTWFPREGERNVTQAVFALADGRMQVATPDGAKAFRWAANGATH